MPSTKNRTATAAALPEAAALNHVSDPSPLSEAQDSDTCDYSAPSLEDLRSKMKELDSVSTHLKKMLLQDDWSGTEAEGGLADSILCDSKSLNADNSAPQALLAYAGT